MRINRIRLTNFRNYGRLDVDVGPSVNIVYGDNGEGKTSLIESVFTGSCVVSHKTSKDKELIKIGESGYEIILNMTDDDGIAYELKDSVELRNDVPFRTLFCNNAQIPRISDYVGICNTVIFAPEDLDIVKGSPSERRKFINLMITKISPVYINLIGHVEKFLKQRSESLKRAASSGKSVDMINAELDYWDYPLCDKMAEMIIYRYRYITILGDIASKYHSIISGTKNENLELKYSTITGCIELIETFLDENDMRDVFITHGLDKANFDALRAIVSSHILKKMLSVRKYDIERCVTSVSVKKDDVELLLNGAQMRIYSSQGQQRSAALSLKIAELEMLKKYTGSTPILLLDDVFSELDQNRRVSLVSAIKGTQIFITCTDRSYIEQEIASLAENIGDIRYFCIKNGSIFS
ncbi:MAG: DNA replication and repair protein RecF [Saccharofermentans sp.]|nr:DNA replication and repair protein RecF [Saccharofermentans sp.]